MKLYYCMYTDDLLLVEEGWIGDNGSRWNRIQFDDKSKGHHQFFTKLAWYEDLDHYAYIGEL